MKLIPEWKKAWRMFSVQAMTLATAMQTAWIAIPEDLKVRIPESYVNGVSIALLVAGILGRMVQQDSVQPPQ